MYYYFLPQPTYLLVAVGLFIGLTCGVAFEATLKQTVNTWYRNPRRKEEDLLSSGALQLPFLGVCAGICIFLAAGLDIFILNNWLAYAIALPLTIFIGSLIWVQLGKVLGELQRGGSKALDLDSF